MLEVKADDEHNGLKSMHLQKATLALNNSLPSPSQTLAQNIDIAKTKGKQTISTSGLPSAPSTTVAVKQHKIAKEGATVAANDTTFGSGHTGPLAPCGSMKRSRSTRGRIAAYLNPRECVAPIAQEPAPGLLPGANESSGAKSKPKSTPSPKPQAAQDTQQTDSQPAKVVPQIESQPATPAVAPATINSPVVVQGQTVPANGNPITISSKQVKLSSGYIYVGSSTAPIPQAEATQLHVKPIVADTLTFHPASPTQVLKVEPSPVVVGGLTFSAPQSVPSVESNTTPNQDQAQPVVVGGKTYAPASPTTQAGNSQAYANTPGQEAFDEQSNSAVNNSNTELDQLSPLPGQADLKPIVIGDKTYTPVTANPTPTPQSPAVFYYDGVALTQGGSAITISSTRISLGPSGVFLGTSSIPFSTITPIKSLLNIGSQTLTALSGSEVGFEIDHSALFPGSSAIFVAGTRYSINTAGSLIAGTSTIALATAGSSNTSNTALAVVGQTFTPLGSTAVVVDGSTLFVGGSAITENGTRISLASTGLVVGSSTFSYATPVGNAVTASTASATFSTGVLPSGGAILTTFPSATGGVEKSAASGKRLSPRLMTLSVGVSMFLSLLLRSLCVMCRLHELFYLSALLDPLLYP